MPENSQRLAYDLLVIGSRKARKDSLILFLILLYFLYLKLRCHSRRSRLQGCGPCGCRYEARVRDRRRLEVIPSLQNEPRSGMMERLQWGESMRIILPKVSLVDWRNSLLI